MNPARLSSIALPDDQGCKMFHIKMKMPMMISNRSIITCFYEHELEDGTKLKFHSSQGNESAVEAQRAEIGKDVIGINEITWFSWKPYDGGLELKQIMKMDPAGMIPGFVKNKIAKRAAGGLLLLVDYLKTGAIPEDMF